jgi:DNA polymerase sigma
MKNDSKILTKNSLNWTNCDVQRNHFCIQDPFEVNFNVGRSVSDIGLVNLKYEFKRCYFMLCKKIDFDKILLPLNFN